MSDDTFPVVPRSGGDEAERGVVAGMWAVARAAVGSWPGAIRFCLVALVIEAPAVIPEVQNLLRSLGH
jgi:hypothetical protein